jgi:hypothetical protein
VALCLYDGFGIIVWDGYFPLTVSLVSAKPDRLSRVWAGSIFRRDDAIDILSHPQPERLDGVLREVANFRGPFVVDVACSGSTSGLGRERWYACHRALLLLIEYTDGRREVKVVDTPDGRPAREVTVPIP